MSQALADLLGKSKEDAAKWIESMEYKTGYYGQDVRFLSEADLVLRQKIKRLGLDPDDTTDEELYHSLIAKYGHDSALVNKALAVEDSADFMTRQRLAIGLLGHIVTDAQSWSLKGTAVKSVLRTLPPKKLMKVWNYRSVASLLKREDVGVVAMAAEASEPAVWQKRFKAAVKRLDQTHYSLQPVRIVKLDDKRDWGSQRCLADARFGTVAINPGNTSDLPVLSLALLLLRNIEKISVRHSIKSLAKVSPTLAWWQGAEHLMRRAGNKPVSLNIHDVSRAYDDASKFGEHVFEDGAKTLFDKLSESYEALAEKTGTLATKLTDEVEKPVNPVRELAMEAIEV